MLLLRAIVALIALPVVVAGIVPALLVQGAPIARRMLLPGTALLAVGVLMLLWCVRDFLVRGRGTLAPWDPPKRLVVVGFYRFVRNPMYVAVLTIVAGWSLLYGSGWLLLYGVALAVAFHVRVTRHEEPRLSRQFGPEWAVYARDTGRWFPRGRRQNHSR